jgi:hypothetical protein
MRLVPLRTGLPEFRVKDAWVSEVAAIVGRPMSLRAVR